MAYRSNGAIVDRLHQYIAAFDRTTARAGTALLADRLDTILRLATANGVIAAVLNVHAIESAVGRGEYGPAIRNGLTLLKVTARCGVDPHSGAVLAAAYSRNNTG